jgi:hypothetical protein
MTLKRVQTGQLIESSGFIYIRFYRDRKRVAEKLRQVDDKHYSAKARTVRMLQNQFMASINAPAIPSSVIAVPEFYETHYIPYSSRFSSPRPSTATRSCGTEFSPTTSRTERSPTIRRSMVPNSSLAYAVAWGGQASNMFDRCAQPSSRLA